MPLVGEGEEENVTGREGEEENATGGEEGGGECHW